MYSMPLSSTQPRIQDVGSDATASNASHLPHHGSKA